MIKSRRHFAIKDILAHEHITTQEELRDSLREHGFNVTQATVSRDIKELQLVKVPEGNGYHYSLPDAQGSGGSYERLKRLFRDSVARIDYCENIIVIKTLPGAAQSVAMVIDASNLRNILGTVGGDDTVISVVKPSKATPQVVAMFEKLLEY